MVSTTNITLDADTRVEAVTHPSTALVWVEVGVLGHALALHADAPEDLERLASELVSAANALREVRAARDAA